MHELRQHQRVFVGSAGVSPASVDIGFVCSAGTLARELLISLVEGRASREPALSEAEGSKRSEAPQRFLDTAFLGRARLQPCHNENRTSTALAAEVGAARMTPRWNPTHRKVRDEWGTRLL